MVNTADPAYVYALEDAWIGGKKNDIIVVMGVTHYPDIEWVEVTSWSKSEGLKIELRDKIKEVKALNHKEEILAAVEKLVGTQYQRAHMSDYKWLMASVQPGTGVTLGLFLFGVALAIGLTIYFVKNDPFDGRSSYYR